MSGLTGMGLGAFGNNDRTAQNTGMPSYERRGSRVQDDADGEPYLGLHKTSSRQSQRHSISHDATRTGATSVTEVGTPQREPQEKLATTPGGGETDSLSSEDGEDTEEERRNSAVQALARHYTHQSQMAGIEPGTNIFLAASDPDSPLNPNGEKFRARTWAKAVVDMMSTTGHAFRTTGVAFQNLNVYGFGSATDYQKDVANVWMEAATIARKLLGQGKRRIDILRDFDGVVRKGEMLVVLGPPGSGCTTLLKTIAGDYNGIFVDGDSYFNYQGKRKFLFLIYTLPKLLPVVPTVATASSAVPHVARGDVMHAAQIARARVVLNTGIEPYSWHLCPCATPGFHAGRPDVASHTGTPPSDAPWP